MKVEMACPGYQVNAVTARDWTSRSSSDLSVPKLRSEHNESPLRGLRPARAVAVSAYMAVPRRCLA
jgi:hypothetical protein